MFTIYCETSIYAIVETENEAKVIVDNLNDMGYNSYSINELE